MADFVSNLRDSLNNYSGGSFDADKLNREAEQLQFAINHGSKIAGNTTGTAGLAALWAGVHTGNPIAAAIGGGLGLLAGGADAYIRTGHVDNLIKDRRKINSQIAKLNVENWTDYKNDQIERNTGKTVGDWAREGKMFLDDGTIEDIDYDYYATVPYQTLERMFGDGADDVKKVIKERKGKKK